MGACWNNLGVGKYFTNTEVWDQDQRLCCWSKAGLAPEMRKWSLGDSHVQLKWETTYPRAQHTFSSFRNLQMVCRKDFHKSIKQSQLAIKTREVQFCCYTAALTCTLPREVLSKLRNRQMGINRETSPFLSLPLSGPFFTVSVKSLWHLLCCGCEGHAYDLEKIMLCWSEIPEIISWEACEQWVKIVKYCASLEKTVES
jgi:hypothetical protein